MLAELASYFVRQLNEYHAEVNGQRNPERK
jgi:hypothetical protein